VTERLARLYCLNHTENEMNDQEILELKLTVAETNGILQALGQMPFVQVASLIQKIQQQAAPQVQTAQPAPTEG